MFALFAPVIADGSRAARMFADSGTGDHTSRPTTAAPPHAATTTASAT